ncbi:MAG TPA: LytTR family transcriptional regulator DNA-binding domain-containing protein [Allosphingosinicella sp.]|jgi:hypothetical protein
MQLAKRERGIPDQLRQLALVLGFGAIMGLAGPFGTYPALDRPVRYAFWIGLVLAGYAFALGAARLSELFPGLARAGRVTMNGLIALASAVPMTFVVAWTLSLVHPGRVVPPIQLPVLFACVAAVQLVIIVALIRPVVAPLRPAQPLHPMAAPNAPDAGAPGHTAALHQPEMPENKAPIAPAERAADARESEAPSVAPPAFPAVLLARMPRGLGPEIVALEAEDHYVRVHTPRGSTLVLMRLSDAVELLDAAIGLRVHRSWWVARQAIASFDRDGQQLTLRLTNGAQVPVGRTYLAAVRTALRDT